MNLAKPSEPGVGSLEDTEDKFGSDIKRAFVLSFSNDIVELYISKEGLLVNTSWAYRSSYEGQGFQTFMTSLIDKYGTKITPAFLTKLAKEIERFQ